LNHEGEDTNSIKEKLHLEWIEALMMKKILKLVAPVMVGAAILLSSPQPARAYVEAPYTLGRLVTESTNVLLMRVEKVDREKNLIIYRKVKDLKGVHPTDIIKHNIGHAGFNPREWQYAMEGAQVGNLAVMFHNGGASENFLPGYWYQAYAGDWWAMSHGEPFLLRSYAGKPEKLAAAVTSILAGQEVVVPCMVDDKTQLHTRAAKIQRVKASLKLLDYNVKRDFVGWGNEDFRTLLGMPAFSMYTGITRTDPEAGGVAAIDYDGDGKTDVCVYGAGKLALLKNAGTSLEEAPLPYTGGARAAAWGDWNGDKKPDLLLATPTGPVLLTNNGDGTFRDDTKLLPKEGYYSLTTAAWIDQDGDGKQDILLANGFLGMRLYKNTYTPPADPKAKPADGKLAFEDVSDKVGLGRNGIAAGVKGYQIAIGDIDGDGRADFLYSAGNGMVVRNTASGFVVMNDSGIAFKPGKVAPVLADFDNDGKLDVTLVDGNQIKLFKNDGKGKFADVTGQRGDLTKPVENIACISWADFDNQGRQDLFVGVLKGPNRFFRNGGDGKFTDASEAIGLTQKVFNTRAICVVDLNGDKVPDVVFNNEGQESSVLIGNPKRTAKKVADAR
jgi:hypothetical protein